MFFKKETDIIFVLMTPDLFNDLNVSSVEKNILLLRTSLNIDRKSEGSINE